MIGTLPLTDELAISSVTASCCWTRWWTPDSFPRMRQEISAWSTKSWVRSVAPRQVEQFGTLDLTFEARHPML